MCGVTTDTTDQAHVSLRPLDGSTTKIGSLDEQSPGSRGAKARSTAAGSNADPTLELAIAAYSRDQIRRFGSALRVMASVMPCSFATQLGALAVNWSSLSPSANRSKW